MKITMKAVYGFLEAIEGLRLSYGSMYKSDSDFTKKLGWWNVPELGTKDIELAQKLIRFGDDHAKALRLIIVYMDVVAPLYWWKQFDTYRAGVEKCSASTMHTIMRRGLTQEDFEGKVFTRTLDGLNQLISCRGQDKKWAFEEINKNLPQSYLQKRKVMISYQAAKNIHKARKNHKLAEWKTFCTGLEQLPYFEELINV